MRTSLFLCLIALASVVGCADSTPGGDDCTPESDAELCTRNGATCDELVADDNCGVQRTVTCGSCSSPEVCIANLCALPACADGELDPGETDVDCGGACPGCADDDSCLVDADCVNGFCRPDAELCATPDCSDGYVNQDETDEDCGGNLCPLCADDFACLEDSDCVNDFCTPDTGLCATAGCGDGYLDTGVEECDDGNLEPSDGCDDQCSVCPVGVTRIATCDDLQAIENDVNGDYCLVQDIDCSATNPADPDNAASQWTDGQGFRPVGGSFGGTLNGNAFVIRELFIDRPTEQDVGLFRNAGGGAIWNLGLVDIDVTGRDKVGGLVGDNATTIRRSYVTGSVTGTDRYIGGLTGDGGGAQIHDCYSMAAVHGPADIGSLAGSNWSSTIVNSYAAGPVNCSGACTDIAALASDGTCTGSFWNPTDSGQSSDPCATESTQSAMLLQSTYENAGWDFTSTWKLDAIEPAGSYYPCLAWQEDATCPPGP